MFHNPSWTQHPIKFSRQPARRPMSHPTLHNHTHRTVLRLNHPFVIVPTLPHTPPILRHSLLLHHELDKLIIIDPSIAILVRLADHLVDLLVGQLLADGGHDMAQLGGGDEAVVVAVKDLGELLATAARPCEVNTGQTLKASRISSSESVSFILRAIMVKNSG